MTQKFKEKRKAQRIAIDMTVEVCVSSHEQFMKEHSTNISRNGMFIRTQRTFSLGSILHLRFLIEPNAILIEGLARIVHLSDNKNTGIGVEFIELTDESKALIEKIVKKRK